MRAIEKFECQCGTYENNLELDFDEQGAYCVKCGGFIILTKKSRIERLMEILQETLPNYPFGSGIGGHKDEGREGFIKRLVDKLSIYVE